MLRYQASLLAKGLALFVFAVLLAGCGSDSDSSKDSSLPLTESLIKSGDSVLDQLFVGSEASNAAFVAVGWRGEDAIAYLCDGDTLGLWFSGSVKSGSFELSHPSGAKLIVASRTTSRISGQVTDSASASLSFDIEAAGFGDSLIRLRPVDSSTPTSGLIMSDLAIKGTLSTVPGGSTGAPPPQFSPTRTPTATPRPAGSGVTNPVGAPGSTGNPPTSTPPPPPTATPRPPGSSSGTTGVQVGSPSGSSSVPTTGGTSPVSGSTSPVSPGGSTSVITQLEACVQRIKDLTAVLANLNSQRAAVQNSLSASISQQAARQATTDPARRAALDVQLANLINQRDQALAAIQLQIQKTTAEIDKQKKVCDQIEKSLPKPK